MTHLYNQQRLTGTLPSLWRAFLAGAGAFGADLPRLTSRAIPPEPPAAAAAICAAVLAAAIGRTVGRDEIVPAGFEIEITPCAFWVRFGSGRSAIAMMVALDGAESYVITGERFPEAEMQDPAGAKVSAQQRHDAASDAL